MDIDNLREKRQSLELDIAEYVSMLVEKFKSETGVCPYNITIKMLTDATITGDRERRYIVSGCDVHIEI